MKFVSTKIVDDRRLSFSIPLEVVNIKDFTKEESSYVTFNYDIEDYVHTLPFNGSEYSCLCVLKIKDNDLSLTVAFPASQINSEEITRYIISDDNFDNCITGCFELTDEEKITLLIQLYKVLCK